MQTVKIILGIIQVVGLLLAAPALAQNLALNKNSYASTAQQATANAFDGDGNTRWESAFTDPQYLIVDLGSVQTIDRIRLTWEGAYGKDFTLDVSGVTAAPADASWSNVTGGSWTTVKTVTGNATTNNEYGSLGSSGRYVRMYGTARATGYGYSLYEFEVFNFSYNTASNLALGKPATASSTQGGYPASQAFDNDNSTRWGSSFNDNEYVYIDLQGTGSIQRIYLSWETAYGKDFRLEVSSDASTWTTASTVTNNTLHYSEFSYATPVVGRYVRMYGVTRGTGYGFSLYEFQVYGTLQPLPVQLLGLQATAQGAGTVALDWKTASELHNQGFEVQRSADGREFAPLAFVAGAGSKASATAYRYLDRATLPGTAYYRLRQLDQDGTATYSPTVAVATPAAAQLLAASLYPNPAQGRATLCWQASAEGSARYTLHTALGTPLRTETVPSTPGLNSLPLSLEGIAPGTYWVTMEVPGQPAQHLRVQAE